MSDTPRTDGAEFDYMVNPRLVWVVPAEFARELERELAAAKTALELCQSTNK